MTFDRRYPLARPGDETRPGIVRTSNRSACPGCGEETRWFSAVYAAPCCSAECLAVMARWEGRLTVVDPDRVVAIGEPAE